MYLSLLFLPLMFCYTSAVLCPNVSWFPCGFWEEDPTECIWQLNAFLEIGLYPRSACPTDQKRCMAVWEEDTAAIKIYCAPTIDARFCKKGRCRFHNGVPHCCCETKKCVGRLPEKIIKFYMRKKLRTTTSRQQPSTAPIVTVTQSLSSTTSPQQATTTPVSTVSQSHNQRVQCFEGKDGECELNQGDSCFIKANRSGHGWQGCDNSGKCNGVMDGCQHEFDGILCCCRADHCNSLCFLDTGLSQVQCVDEVKIKEASHPWLLFITIGVLLFLVIVLIVLQIVGAQIRRRRSDKGGRKLVFRATQHWVKNQQPQPDTKPIYAPPAPTDPDAEIFK